MIDSIVQQLVRAWNAADGAGYAAPFAEDADFVTVYGFHAKGRGAIAAGHDGIFQGIYRGSNIRMNVEHVRELSPGVLLVHLRAHLSVPEGKMAGDHVAVPSLVLTRGAEGWQIAALHNTFVTPPPGS